MLQGKASAGVGATSGHACLVASDTFTNPVALQAPRATSLLADRSGGT
eukprot:COSAG06_NODE_58972_length_275_cov_1.170455_1_plen_47_part_10